MGFVRLDPQLTGCTPRPGLCSRSFQTWSRYEATHQAGSSAFYVTHYGKKMSGIAYADDGRHYTDGAAALPMVNRELAAGSRFSGNSANPSKSWAYASDWDFHAASPQGRQDGYTTEGLAVQAYDIYTGEDVMDTITRATWTRTRRGKGGHHS